MDVLKTLVFRGPNRWSGQRVAELHVETREPHTAPATDSRRYRQAWLTWLPALRASADAAFRVLPAQRTAAAARLEQFRVALAGDHPQAELFGLAVRSAQLACGVDVEFVAARETDEPGVELVAIGYEEEALLKGCTAAVLRWDRAARSGEALDMAAELRALVDLADDVRLGPSSLAILRAAAARGISHRRLGAGSLVQLGEGRFQRRIWTAETDATSAIAESIAQDKQLTKRLLRVAGVPVPLGRAVTSPTDAWNAAREIGLPVVVKPRKANHARGISVNLTTEDEIRRAYDWAVKDGDNTGVLVEQYARGQQHRLLVIGQRLVAAARGESEYVVGDGRLTIRQLVECVNADPRRGENYTDPLNVLKLDDSALIELGRQGLTPESVPAVGQRVLVQQVGDLTTDCTHDVHPENAAHAVLAARVVGLDVAGMDVVADDIARPLQAQRGAILEVNAGPSLGMHVAPLVGQPQPVGEAMIELLFPHQQRGRIPIIAVTGDGPRAETVRRIEQLWSRLGKRVGAATAAELTCGQRRVSDGWGSDAENLTALLMHPEVEIAVGECRPDEAWATGLECDRVDLAVVLLGGTPCDDKLAGGVRAVLHAVPADGTAILPWGTALAEDVAPACRGSLVWLARSLDSHRLETALARGDRAVFVRGSHWVLARREGQEEISFAAGSRLTAPDSLPSLAAVATLWASGCVADRLRELCGTDDA